MNKHEPLQWYPTLLSIAPVISNRSQLKVKVRLYFNYFLETLVLISPAFSTYFGFEFTVNYLREIFIALRIVLYFIAYKLNINDRAICCKIIIIVQEFTFANTLFIPAEIVLFCVHIAFALILALSCQQRRGQFDQRLGVKLPFMKQMLVVTCPFLVHSIPGIFENLYYPTLIFAVIHFIFCYFDDMYNHSVKKIIQGMSLLGLTFIGVICFLEMTQLSKDSIIIVACILYTTIVAWLVNKRQFTEFKILQQNPNSFSEWDYKDYFEKLIYLIKKDKLLGNEEILRGFYKHHNNICFSVECPLRYCLKIQSYGKQQDAYFQLELSTIIKYLQAYIKGQMEIATIKYINLRRMYIFYTSPSLQALRYCDKQNSFIEYRQAKRIEEMYQLKDIQFQRQNNLTILKKIQYCIQTYIDTSNYFWRLLYDNNVDFKRLQDLGIKMIELKEIVLSHQKQPLDIIVMKLIRDFKSYLLEQKVNDIRLNEEEDANNKLYNFIEIHTKDYPIIIISAEPQTLERIENVNASCCRLIGYTKKQLMQKKLNDIIPQFIGTFHSRLMQQRSKQLLYQSQKKLATLAYVTTRSGYIFQTSLTILQLNSMKGRRWSCILTPTNQPNIIIITDGQGLIQSLTTNAYNIGLDLTLIGKPFCPQLFDNLINQSQREWIMSDNHFNHLLYEEQNLQRFKSFNVRFRVKNIVPLISPNKFCVFQLQIRKPHQTSTQKSLRSRIQDEAQQILLPNQWFFNFPNLYSNFNYRCPVNIKLKEQKKYQFINFGEGISQMRYLNGQIQYKQDKSQSSFEKERTEQSLIQIIDFNMKKQTYIEVQAQNKKKLPKPLLEFSLWVIIICVAIIGVGTYSIIIFELQTKETEKQTSVLANLDILKMHYLSIVHSAIEITYMSFTFWYPNTINSSLQNIVTKLDLISKLSPALNYNETYINTFYLNYAVSSSQTLYDIISEFKLQANNLLSNPSPYYILNTPSIFQMMNLTTSYLNTGFRELSNDLLEKYVDSLDNNYYIFIVLCASLLGLILVIFLRIFYIQYRMNQQKTKLLNIFLQVEENTIERILQKNLAFKSLLQHNKPLEHDQKQEQQDLQAEDEGDGSERKRIKILRKYNFCYYLFVLIIIILGIFSANFYIEKQFFTTLQFDMKQIVQFGEAHTLEQDALILMHYIVVLPTPFIGKQSIQSYTPKKIIKVNKSQMKLRKLMLQVFNKRIVSDDFIIFFQRFWFRDACDFLSHQSCRIDFDRVLSQGADKFWLQFSNVLIVLAYAIGYQYNTYKPLLLQVMAYYLKDLNIATKFYSQQIMTLYHNKLLYQIQQQIDRFQTNKIYIFCISIGLVVLSLIIYFVIFFNKIKQSIVRLQQIVGFIPYKKLSNIIAFKKYIRKKYQQLE